MRKIIYVSALALAIAGAASATVLPTGFKGAHLGAMAKVSLTTARATALAARAGVITDQELETEKGGSGLRYSFDIKSAGKSFEVGVDAKTGRLLENGAEGPNAD